jgi:hypothetical protein
MMRVVATMMMVVVMMVVAVAVAVVTVGVVSMMADPRRCYHRRLRKCQGKGSTLLVVQVRPSSPPALPCPARRCAALWRTHGAVDSAAAWPTGHQRRRVRGLRPLVLDIRPRASPARRRRRRLTAREPRADKLGYHPGPCPHSSPRARARYGGCSPACPAARAQCDSFFGTGIAFLYAARQPGQPAEPAAAAAPKKPPRCVQGANRSAALCVLAVVA